ncbi:MAG: hypothetical protein GX051_09165 [Clostridiales bacterium]|nr:hypothetical protein [Clostridiales bacterium]
MKGKTKKLISVALSLVLLFTMLFSVPVTALYTEPGITGEVTALAGFLNQLDFSGISNAQKLDCDASDPATWSFVDYSSATGAVTGITIRRSQVVGVLDLTGFSSLENVSVNGNGLTDIKLSGCSALETIDCSYNALTSLVLEGGSSLVAVYAAENRISNFRIKNTAASLVNIWMSFNKIDKIDFSKCPNVENLYLCGNLFYTMDVSSLTALKELDVSGNMLDSFDASALTALTSLNVASNEIEQIVLPAGNVLDRLFIGDNKFNTPLDLSRFTFSELFTENSGLNAINTSIKRENGSVCTIDISGDDYSAAFVRAGILHNEETGTDTYTNIISASVENGKRFSGWYSKSTPAQLVSTDIEYDFSAESSISLTAQTADMVYNNDDIAKVRGFLDNEDETGTTNYEKLGIDAATPVSQWKFAEFDNNGRVITLWFQNENQEILSGVADFSAMSALELLFIDACASPSINITGCTALTSFTCNSLNEEKPNIDIILGNNTALKDFTANSYTINTLDLSQVPNLQYFNLFSCEISLNTISLARLDTIDFSDTVLACALDLSGCTALERLNLRNCEITGLTLAQGIKLSELDLSGNMLSGSLDLRDFTQLQYALITEMPLTSIALKLEGVADEVVTLDVSAAANGNIGLEYGWIFDEALGTDIMKNSIIAYPNEGYMLEGWYEQSVKLSSDASFAFAANRDYSISVKFTSFAYSQSDVAKIKTFLELTGSSGETNYSLLGINIEADPRTWETEAWSEDMGYIYKNLVEFDASGRVVALWLPYDSAVEGVLDLSGLSALRLLEISSCLGITSLNISGCTSLKSIYNNSNTFIPDFTQCPGLMLLTLNNVGGMSQLDLSGLAYLKSLEMCSSGFSSVDISGCNSLERIATEDSGLKKIILGDVDDKTEITASDNVILNICEGENRIGEYVKMVSAVVENTYGFTGWYSVPGGELVSSEPVIELAYATAFGNVQAGAVQLEANTAQMNALKAFFNQSGEDGLANYQKLSIDIDDFKSWNGVTWVEKDGELYVKELSIPGGLGVSGTLTLDGFSELESLYIDYCGISSLSLDGCTSLQFLFASGNPITTLDLSDCVNLITVNLNDIKDPNYNQTGLENRLILPESLPHLEQFEASNAGLTQFALNSSSVACLRLRNNELTSIDLSSMPKLIDIELGENKLTTLDASGHRLLESLSAGYNRSLSSLNISASNNIKHLYIEETSIINSLDLSNLTLFTLRTEGTSLTDISFNGKYNGMTRSVSLHAQQNAVINSVIFGSEWDEELGVDVDAMYAVADGTDGYVFDKWYNNKTSSNLLDGEKIELTTLFNTNDISLNVSAREAVPDDAELAQIKTFLDQRDNFGITNAQKLSVDSNDISTWSEIVTIGKENVKEINISQQNVSDEAERIVGELELDGFTNLEVVTLDLTALTQISLQNCPELREFKSWGAPLTYFNAPQSSKLENLELNSTDLTSFEASFSYPELRFVNFNNSRELSYLNLGGCYYIDSVFIENTGLTSFDYDSCYLRTLRYAGSEMKSLSFTGIMNEENKTIELSADENTVITKCIFGSEWDETLGNDVEAFYAEAEPCDGEYILDAWYDSADNLLVSEKTICISDYSYYSTISLNAKSVVAEKDAAEIGVIKTFLLQTDALGNSNADKLFVDVNDVSSWYFIIWRSGHIAEIHIDQNDQEDSQRLTGTLDVSGFSGLEKLEVCNTEITEIDVSGCPELYDLCCWCNDLTTLIFTNCAKLRHIDCFGNKLTSLDFTGVAVLDNLKCSDNLITSLDLSAYDLNWLETRNNPLIYIKARMYKQNENDAPSEFFAELHGTANNYVGLMYDNYNNRRVAVAYATPKTGWYPVGWCSDSACTNQVSDDQVYELNLSESCLLYTDAQESYVTSIELVSSPQLDYFAGDLFNMSDLRIRVNYGNGKSAEISQGIATSLYEGKLLEFSDDSTVVNISYGGASINTRPITVSSVCSRGVTQDNILLCDGSQRSLEQLKLSMVNDGLAANVDEIAITDADGNAVYDGFTRTGLTVGVGDMEFYRVSLLGDTNCDGAVNERDFNMLLLAAVGYGIENGGMDTLDKCMLSSADYNSDTAVDGIDVAYMELLGW